METGSHCGRESESPDDKGQSARPSTAELYAKLGMRREAAVGGKRRTDFQPPADPVRDSVRPNGTHVYRWRKGVELHKNEEETAIPAPRQKLFATIP